MSYMWEPGYISSKTQYEWGSYEDFGKDFGRNRRISDVFWHSSKLLVYNDSVPKTRLNSPNAKTFDDIVEHNL